MLLSTTCPLSPAHRRSIVADSSWQALPVILKETVTRFSQPWCHATECKALIAANSPWCIAHLFERERSASVAAAGAAEVNLRDAQLRAETLAALLRFLASDGAGMEGVVQGRVSLAKARIAGDLRISGVRFADVFDFSGVAVVGGCMLDHCIFLDRAHFNNASIRSRPAFPTSVSFVGTRFEGPAFFTGCRFRSATFFSGTSFGSEASFYGSAFEDGCDFEKAAFQGDVDFSRCLFASAKAWAPAASFAGVSFESALTSRDTTFAGIASFSRARFNGTVVLEAPVIRSEMSFADAVFQDTAHLGPMLVGSLDLSGASFVSRPVVEASAGRVRCWNTQFAKGGDLRLRWAAVELDGVRATGPTTISTAPPLVGSNGKALYGPRIETVSGRPPMALLDEGDLMSMRRVGHDGAESVSDPRPIILSVRDGQVDQCLFSGVDLSACQFDGAHGLSDMRIEGEDVFSYVPRDVRFWRTRRRIVEAEGALRGTKGSSSWDNPRSSRRVWYEGDRKSQREVTPEGVAGVYRQLRAGLEDAKAYSSASDFYYGEMEMRRRGAPSLTERATIWLYWAVAGYGLRAWRPFFLLCISLIAAAIIFHNGGFAPGGTLVPGVSTERLDAPTTIDALQREPKSQKVAPVIVDEPGSWSDSWLVTLQSATNLFRGTSTQFTLTRPGEFLSLLLRVICPLLIAFGLLALRARVHR